MARRPANTTFVDRLFQQAVDAGVPISEVRSHVYEFNLGDKRIEFRAASGATVRLTSYDENGAPFGTVVRNVEYVEGLLARAVAES